MTDRIQALSEEDRREVEAMAKALSRYGLAITVPHMHEREGRAVPLPRDLVAYEKDLRVSFVTRENLPVTATPMTWRWLDGQLQVCAGCCMA